MAWVAPEFTEEPLPAQRLLGVCDHELRAALRRACPGTVTARALQEVLCLRRTIGELVERSDPAERRLDAEAHAQAADSPSSGAQRCA